MSLAAFHELPRGTAGRIVRVTVETFIGSLNWTTIVLPSGTRTPPSGGSVETINGWMHTVSKEKGLGTGPGTRARSSFLSFPPVISTAYPVQSRSGAVGVSFRVLSPEDHENAAETPPLIVHVTEDTFIDSLKFTQIGAATGHPVEPAPGLVWMIAGGWTGHFHVSARSSRVGVTRPFPVFSFARTRKYSLPLFPESICEPHTV